MRWAYDISNDTVENAADKIMAIIRAEHAKTRRTITEYMKMVALKWTEVWLQI